MYKNQQIVWILTQMFSKYEPESTKELTDCTVKILDAKCKKADLPQIVKDICSHLTESKKLYLFSLLHRCEQIFDGALGEWKTEPFNFELKEGAQPYHGCPFPVPQIHKATLHKEVDQMAAFGILKRESKSEWAFPSFIIPKSNQTVQFISDF